MYHKKIAVNPPISIALDAELKKKLYYLSDKITAFETKKINNEIIEIELELSSDMNMDMLKSKVDHLLDFDIRKRRIIPEEKVWESNCNVHYDDAIFEKMLGMGIVYEQACGQMAFNRLFIDLMHYIDHKIKEISVNQFNALEYQYPTLVPTSVVEKCGYIKNFPHLIMFVTYLHNDIDNYTAFKDYVDSHHEIPELLFGKYCKNNDYCLPPTMCYYTYNQFSNKKFKDGENIVITSKGKSFRYESKYASTIERLWDFTIRETVFLGDYEFVNSCRQNFMGLMFKLVEALKLEGYCCNASDSFFMDEQMMQNIAFQKALKSKYELQLNITETKSIAVGSFNYHDSFFGKNFNMCFDNNQYIKTGCTGFGLERFAYAFLCQHGLNEAQWPIKLR